MAIFKGVAGVLGHSYALIADAIESTTDVFSSTLLLVGMWFGRLPPDENHPYGHGRAEALATFVVVAFLLGLATIIAVESVQHILTPIRCLRRLLWRCWQWSL
ncbi:cation diffusion facilitator family transporter [Rappaport israeli]|uniref:cation diffusion facilitator family transporter n=1 Tax=Rappaport israeli TaxID=1839807 RepID=UPI000ABB6B5F|nr:cation diffusion facilitator family transporter [Rappaport israeli]